MSISRYVKSAARTLTAFAMSLTIASPTYADNKSIDEVIRDTAPRDGSYLVFIGDATGDGIPDIAYQGSDKEKMVFFKLVDGATGKMLREGKYNESIDYMAPVPDDYLPQILRALKKHTGNARAKAPGNNSDYWNVMDEYDYTRDGMPDVAIEELDWARSRKKMLAFDGKGNRRILDYPLNTDYYYVSYNFGDDFFALKFLNVERQGSQCKTDSLTDWFSYDGRNLVLSGREGPKQSTGPCGTAGIAL